MRRPRPRPSGSGRAWPNSERQNHEPSRHDDHRPRDLRPCARALPHPAHRAADLRRAGRAEAHRCGAPRAARRCRRRRRRRAQPLPRALVQRRRTHRPGRRAGARGAARGADRHRLADHRRTRRPLPDDPRAQGAAGLCLPRLAPGHRPLRPGAPARAVAVHRQLLPRRRGDLARRRLPWRGDPARRHERRAFRVAGALGHRAGRHHPHAGHREQRARDLRRLRGACQGPGQRHPQPVQRVRQLPGPLRRHRACFRACVRERARARSLVAVGRLRLRQRLGRHAGRRRLAQGTPRREDRRRRGARMPDHALQRLRRAQHPGHRRQAHPVHPQRHQHRRRRRRVRPRHRPTLRAVQRPRRPRLAARTRRRRRRDRGAAALRLVEHLQRRRGDQDRQDAGPGRAAGDHHRRHRRCRDVHVREAEGPRQALRRPLRRRHARPRPSIGI